MSITLGAIVRRDAGCQTRHWRQYSTHLRRSCSWMSDAACQRMALRYGDAAAFRVMNFGVTNEQSQSKCLCRWCTMKITIPKLSPRRPDRPQRVGQEHVRPQALPADRGPLVGLLPGDGQRRRERPGGHERCLRGAALHRRQAAGPGAADGRRRHQRPARGPQAAGRAGPASTTACRWPSCSTCPSGSARSGTATGPTATSARTSSATSASQLRRSLRGLERGGLPPRLRAGDARGGRGGDRRAGAALERPDATSTARSTSSATSTAAATNWKNCSSGSATARSRWTATSPAGAIAAYAHPEGRKAVFVGDLVDRGPRILDTLRLVRNMVAIGSALCVPGNHDMKLLQEAAGQERADHARAGRDAGRDRRPARRRAGAVLQANWPSSSTGWSATTSSTTASWSSPTPG